jgi:small GTP-binding protein
MGGTSATRVSVDSAEEAISLIEEHSPSSLCLLRDRSSLSVDDDHHDLTIILDDVLFSAEIDGQPATIHQIVSHPSGLTDLTIQDIYLPPETLDKALSRSPAIASLTLNGCGLGEASARSIGNQLLDLSALSLNVNGISDAGVQRMARHLAGLTRLASLKLDTNGISDNGAIAIARHLRNLTHLTLWHNRISDDGAEAIAEQLTNLTALELGYNEIGNVGAQAIAKHLTYLDQIGLEKNEIGEPGIRAVLDSLLSRDTTSVSSLKLHGNPGVTSIGLGELTQSEDAHATLAAYRRLIDADEEDLVALGEAKLVVLGDEAVGKTSLVRALVDGQRADPNEQKTQGVNHRIWVTPWTPTTDEKVQLNIWDFGGQEIMHQTHRYFLTERCIFLLVLDRRKQDDTSAVTWLRTARHRAPNSPVVVVVNKCDNGTHNLDIDFVRLQQDFPEIAGVFEASCSPEEGHKPVGQIMAPIRHCLKQLLTNDARLDSVRARVPKAWVRVRDDVRVRAGQVQVLSATDFVNLCQTAHTGAERVTDAAEQRALLGMLNQMGVVVAHGLTPTTTSLAGLTLLDPNWFTGAVYVLLDYGQAEFDRNVLGEKLRSDPDKAPLYPDEWLDYIIDLLQQPQFALAFRLPGAGDPPRYLLPEALTPTAPGAAGGWDPDSLRFRLRYQQLPRGLIPQFQVLSHMYARPDDDRWRAGCTFLIDECAVLVDGSLADNRIDIHVTGPRHQRRNALAVVRSVFAKVHQRMPEAAPTERVPLPDEPELDVGYDHLRTLEREEGPGHQFRPEGAQRKYTVAELLHGVRHARSPNPLPARPGDEPRHTPPIEAQNSTNRVATPVSTPRSYTATATTTANRSRTGNRPGRPEPPRPSPNERTGRSADYGQIWGALGGAAGALGAAVYLLGRDTDWPLELILAGSAVGVVAGSVLGVLVGLVLNRH